MPLAELVIAVILRVPDIIHDSIQIRRTIIDRMLVETVEAGLVDHIDDSLVGITDSQRRVAIHHITIRIGFHYRTEMDALQRITCSMSCQHQLPTPWLNLMRHLGREKEAAIDSTSQADGNELVRM